ncbi:MAG: hypothetical protein JW821_17770 [Deltaproteobacteria bacterium]|nr:hypothetical protein [Deltaproteobacteria bacterium]
MRLTLIGMAGTGKSYWSKRLEEKGFKRLCCDESIAAKLETELTRRDGTRLTMGQWMGFPYQEHYREREATYLACEISVVSEIAARLEGQDAGQDIVVDTAGSVIYTGDDLLKRLGRVTTIVHLSTPPEAEDRLLRAYLKRPHPMLWQGMFQQAPEESTEEAFARCYPRLLLSRRRLYERYAQVTLDYHERREEGFGVREFLDRVLKTKEGSNGIGEG